MATAAALPELEQKKSSGLGIIPFKNATELQEEDAEKARQSNLSDEPSYISDLASHIDSCYSDAKHAKQKVERVMIQSMNARNGIYEADKLAAIREIGGSEVFVMLTGTKCRAAEAWINDVLRPVSDQPWKINPTPLPSLPPNVMSELRAEVEAIAQQVMIQAQTINAQVNDGELTAELREYAQSRHDEILEEAREEAKKRCMRMEMKIADQLAEGGWYESFWAVVSDFVTLPASVIKGPVIRRRKVQKWVDTGGGKWTLEAKDELVPEYDRVSPFDLYPAPDSRGPDDGYIIERHRFSRSELQALIGVPSYNDDKIKQALKDYSGGLSHREPIDTERDALEFSGETSTPTMYSEKIEALQFWGSVQGQLLIDWGLTDNIDPETEYEIDAWKVGDIVIKAVLNPDKLGRKPYSVDSYERIPGSFWGKGIPQLMSDLQEVCNASARAIVNNSSYASGPQVEVNIDRVENDNEEIWPWKVWQGDNKQLSEAPAVRFFQPQIVTNELMKVFEFFSAQAEDQTGVPRWAYGNTDIGGAGETSSGLSMLMGHAARGIKEAIAHLDRMISGCIERLYDYNMLYDPDDQIKGDAQVVARGSSAQIAKEQLMVRTKEFLQAANNPMDNQILGISGRAKLLAKVAKMMDLEIDDILPDDREIKEIEARIMQERQMQMQQDAMKGATPSKNPQTLDPAGNPAGGTDNNMFQNQAGQTPQGVGVNPVG